MLGLSRADSYRHDEKEGLQWVESSLLFRLPSANAYKQKASLSHDLLKRS